MKKALVEAKEKITKKIEEISEKKSEPKQTLVSLTTKTTLKFWLIWLVSVFLWYLFFESLDVLYMILTSLIIAVSMEGLIISLQKWVKKRGVAIILSYILLIIFVISWVVLIVPFLISQVAYLIDWISNIIWNIKVFVTNNTRPDAISQVTWLPAFFQDYLLEHWWELNVNWTEIQSAILSSLNTLLDSSVNYLKQFSSWVFTFIGSFFSVIGELVIIFTLSVFFSIEKDYLVQLITRCFSKAKRSLANKKIERIYSQLSAWLKARLLLSLILATIFWVCLWILNLFWIKIPSVLTLSVITWLLDIIPYIWPFIAAIPIVLLAFIHNGFWAMIIVGCVFLIIQWIENYVIVPVLMWKQLWVNSILILICALLWAVILWFWWIVLSVPLAVILWLFIDDKNNE